jgi:hypothetical protein
MIMVETITYYMQKEGSPNSKGFMRYGHGRDLIKHHVVVVAGLTLVYPRVYYHVVPCISRD